jgi:hypothetical protein
LGAGGNGLKDVKVMICAEMYLSDLDIFFLTGVIYIFFYLLQFFVKDYLISNRKRKSIANYNPKILYHSLKVYLDTF